MSIQSGRIAKNTIMLYIRMLLIIGVTFFTSRLIFNALGEEDFGIFNLVGGMSLMFAFFISTLSNATQRFLNIAHGSGNQEEANKIFTLSLTVFFILSLIVFIIGELIGLWLIYNKLNIPEGRMEATLWVFHATMLSLFFTINGIAFNAVLVAHENFKIYAYVGIVEALAKLAIAFLLNFSSFDKLQLYSSLYVTVSVSLVVFYACYCCSRYIECRISYYWDASLFRQLFSFIGWNVVGTAVWGLNSQGLSLLLNSFFGVSVNSARGVSAQVEQAVNSFNTSFMSATKPQVVKLYAAGQMNQCTKLCFESSRYSFFLILFLSIPIIFQREYILDLWLGEAPQLASSFVLWALIFSLINSLTTSPWNAIQAVGKLKNYSLIGGVVYSLVLPLSYIGLLCYPNEILPLIILCTIRLLYLFVILSILGRYIPFRLKVYWRKVVRPIIFVLIPVALGNYLLFVVYSVDSIVSLGVYLLGSMTLSFLAIYYLGITGRDRKSVRNKIKEFIV